MERPGRLGASVCARVFLPGSRMILSYPVFLGLANRTLFLELLLNVCFFLAGCWKNKSPLV